jgi:hypothetical protein
MRGESELRRLRSDCAPGNFASYGDVGFAVSWEKVLLSSKPLCKRGEMAEAVAAEFMPLL